MTAPRSKKTKREAVRARIAARPAPAEAPPPAPPVVEPVVEVPPAPPRPSRLERARAERATRLEARAAAQPPPEPGTEAVAIAPVFAPRFLDLVPEQHPYFFPRKRDKAGQIVNTSRSVWVVEDGDRREQTVVRDPRSVTGICLHQTACVFGPLDRPAVRYRRALRVPAHVTAFRDGVYAQSAPLLWFLYHGNDLNERALGLECEGHYPGLLDDPETPRREDEESTWGGEATPLTPEAIATFRAALRHLVGTGRALGCPIKWIWAHRQASDSRRADPGQALWTEVAEWGVRELGLTARYADVFRDGRPIPREWAEHGVGGY